MFRVTENVELLKARMASIQRSQLELSLDVQQQTDISRVYMSSINALKPELKRLSKRRDQLKKYAQLLDYSTLTLKLARTRLPSVGFRS